MDCPGSGTECMSYLGTVLQSNGTKIRAQHRGALHFKIISHLPGNRLPDQDPQLLHVIYQYVIPYYFKMQEYGLSSGAFDHSSAHASIIKKTLAFSISQVRPGASE